MDLPAEKYELIKWIISLKDESIVKRVKKIKSETLNSEESYQLSDTERLFIEAGLKDIEKGNTYSHEDVMREVKQKYGI
jgi:predicted transcriptional regulator